MNIRERKIPDAQVLGGRRVGWTFHGGVGLSISRLSQECSNARMFECSWSKVCESQIISLKVPSLGNLRKYTNQRIRRLLSRDFHKLRHFRKIKFVHSEKQNCSIKFWAISKKEIMKPVCTYLLYTSTTMESKKNVAVIFPRKVPTLHGGSANIYLI